MLEEQAALKEEGNTALSVNGNENSRMLLQREGDKMHI